MRWLVGDLQGCARQLDALLSEVSFDPARDELWCLGDLVNRGPDSLETARLWRDVGGRGVLGNHEVYALLVRAGAWPRKRDQASSFSAASVAERMRRCCAAASSARCCLRRASSSGVGCARAGYDLALEVGVARRIDQVDPAVVPLDRQQRGLCVGRLPKRRLALRSRDLTLALSDSEGSLIFIQDGFFSRSAGFSTLTGIRASFSAPRIFSPGTGFARRAGRFGCSVMTISFSACTGR